MGVSEFMDCLKYEKFEAFCVGWLVDNGWYIYYYTINKIFFIIEHPNFLKLSNIAWAFDPSTHPN